MGVELLGPFVVKDVPPKKSSPLVPVTVNLPQEVIDKIKALADDQGLTYGDIYRDCFLDGSALQFEKYAKAEVYKKVRGRNEEKTVE